MKVYLESLGCKLNQCERDALARQFAEAGYAVVPSPGEADVCVVNTCAVTQVAAGKSRRRAHRLHRLNPTARVVATGCYTSLAENGLAADLMVPNDRKADLVSLVEEALAEWGLGSSPVDRDAGVTYPMSSRTRPMVKIQDGCDNACAYCIVHVLRGKQCSRPRVEILSEIEELVAQGYHEVVLTGVHVGAYGSDRGDSLVGLVQSILRRCPPDRLRLSSIEPWDLAPGFFTLWQDPRLCRHLHLPLQSGCDATLKRMNRHYSTAQYAALAGQAREAIPDLALTTDVIAGFPGETEAEFAASAAFVEKVGFARAHVFAYSERPGTPAATMPGSVPHTVRRLRARRLREIARQSGESYRRRFLERTMTVLWETQLGDGRWSGLTDTYVRVFTESPEDLHNVLRAATLTALETGGMRGSLVVP